MKVEIKVTDDNGNVEQFVADGSLKQLVWDGLLIANWQDEQWRSMDTCELIVKKLKGESPIEFAKGNNIKPPYFHE